MSLIDDASDPIEVERDGETLSYMVVLQKSKFYGPVEMDIREGDTVKNVADGSTLVVKSVYRPGGHHIEVTF
jgi:hypothetical protein